MSSASSIPVKVCPQCSVQAETEGAYCANCGAPYDRREAPATTGTGISTNLLLWGLGSIAAIVIGSLGTWVTVGPISIGGTSNGRDGIVTLALGLIAVVPVALRRLPTLVGVLAILTLATGIYDTIDVSNSDTTLFNASVGWGLILVDIAAVSLLVWSAFAFRARRRGKRAARHATETASPSAAS